MSDLAALLPETPEDERIRKWREERHRIAEAEKAERLRQRDADRARDAKEQHDVETSIAASLLPTSADLRAIETKIAQRTSRARRALYLQFMTFCVLPVAVVAYYLMAIATPLFEARSVIAVTQPGATHSPNTPGLLGSLNTPINLQEVFMAHEFIQSQAIMDALEVETGLISFLSGPAIDPAQRLRDIPMLALEKRNQFSRFVHSSVDIQTGLITLYVRSPSQAEAVEISDSVLALVAGQVNTLNTDVNGQRLALASKTVSQAQEQLTDAQTRLVSLQLESGEVDPKERVASIHLMINQLEAEALSLGSEIQRAAVSGQSESFQTQRAVALRDRLQAQINEQRALLMSGGADGAESLSALMMQHQLAGLRVNIAEEALTTALAGLADTQKSTAMASSLFQVVVPPRTGIQPAAPNAPSIILVTFVISLTIFALWRMTIGGRQFG